MSSRGGALLGYSTTCAFVAFPLLFGRGGRGVVCWRVDWEEVEPPEASASKHQWSKVIVRFFNVSIAGFGSTGLVSLAVGPSSSRSCRERAPTGMCFARP